MKCDNCKSELHLWRNCDAANADEYKRNRQSREQQQRMHPAVVTPEPLPAAGNPLLTSSRALPPMQIPVTWSQNMSDLGSRIDNSRHQGVGSQSFVEESEPNTSFEALLQQLTSSCYRSSTLDSSQSSTHAQGMSAPGPSSAPSSSPSTVESSFSLSQLSHSYSTDLRSTYRDLHESRIPMNVQRNLTFLGDVCSSDGPQADREHSIEQMYAFEQNIEHLVGARSSGLDYSRDADLSSTFLNSFAAEDSASACAGGPPSQSSNIPLVGCPINVQQLDESTTVITLSTPFHYTGDFVRTDDGPVHIDEYRQQHSHRPNASEEGAILELPNHISDVGEEIPAD